MTYTTIKARIDHGTLIPLEPELLPQEGSAMVVVLDEESRKSDWDVIKSCLGHLEIREDPVQWQKKVRSEWDERI